MASSQTDILEVFVGEMGRIPAEGRPTFTSPAFSPLPPMPKASDFTEQAAQCRRKFDGLAGSGRTGGYAVDYRAPERKEGKFSRILTINDARWVRRVVAAKEMSQREAARRLGVSHRTIQFIINNKLHKEVQ